MRIGIIGTGHIGGTAATLLKAAGHDVVVGSRSGPSSYEAAARHGEVVLLAVPFHAVEELPAAAFEDSIVVDANNYYPGRDGQVAALDANETTSTEILARHLPGARAVVKAFNTMYYETLAGRGAPQAPAEERLVLLLAGDDAGAKATVAALIEEIGFAPVDTCSLADGGRHQQPGAPLYNVEVSPADATEALARPG